MEPVFALILLRLVGTCKKVQGYTGYTQTLTDSEDCHLLAKLVSPSRHR